MMIRIVRYQETHTCKHTVPIAVAAAIVSIYLYLKTIFLFRYELPSGKMAKNEEMERLRLGIFAARFEKALKICVE
jgi:hypothetical protein